MAGSQGWTVVAACALVAACSGPEPGSHPAPPERPNVLLVSIDTLRPDHLHCYGYHRDTSPVIDRLAAEGVLFENHISSTSWTLPAHAALFTGLSDSVHGCTETDRTLAAGHTTVAERFAAAGYVTAGFFSGPYLHPAFGLAQGFDSYVNCTSYASALDDSPNSDWAMDFGVMRASHRDITNPALTSAVTAWLATAREPFFVFVHMWDPHFDFIPPAPYDTMFDPDYQGQLSGEDFFFNPKVNRHMEARDLHHLIALYDGEIRWTDEHLGQIVNELERGNLLDRTVVVVTGDHGTEFFEHGGKGHRMTLFDEVIRIPLVVRYPPHLSAGRRVRAQTRMIDVAPTLLELTNMESTGLGAGRGLLPLAVGGDEVHPLLAISELDSVGHRLLSARTMEWKVLEDLRRGSLQYFELGQDPAELEPLASWENPRAGSIRTTYDEARASLRERAAETVDAAPTAHIPPEVREQLKGLGYLDKENDPSP
jgi:arylsulfatase A-like enzyme